MEVDGGAAPTRSPDTRAGQAFRGDSGDGTREGQGTVAAADDAQLLAATLLPYNYYQSGAARARQEVFVRRGRLTRELTALGLPPVYEHPTGVIVGRQVDAGLEGGGAGGAADRQPRQPKREQQPQQPSSDVAAPAWRRLRSAAANPAHNPVMARNIRAKAQLAQAAARRNAAAQAAPFSARLLRHAAALDEASRTIAKLRVLAPGGAGGGQARRLSSAPLSKPYYPRRLRGGAPANETEGGDPLPGRPARRAAEQVAEEAEAEEARAQRRGPAWAAERRRLARIEELADVIVAAPQLGIHELGAYLPRELAAAAAAAASDDSAAVATGSTGTAASTAEATAELVEALRQLELCAAEGRAVVAAAEGDYGSHFAIPGRRGGGGGGGGGGGTAAAVTIPVLSPVASSYGSGGHYLYEEGMAAEEDDDGSAGGGGSDVSSSDNGSGYGTPAAEVPAAPAVAGARYPDKVTVETDPRVGLVVVRYPAGSAVVGHRAMRRSPDGGVQAARERVAQIAAARTAAATPVDLEAMRRPGAQPGNEAAGGRGRADRQPAETPAPAAAVAAAGTGVTADAAPATAPEPSTQEVATSSAPEGAGAGVAEGAPPAAAAMAGGAEAAGAGDGAAPPPPWRRESHAERVEALLAAAATAKAAASALSTEGEVEGTGLSARGRSSGAGDAPAGQGAPPGVGGGTGGPRVTARAGRLATAAQAVAVAVARRVAAPDRGNGGGGSRGTGPSRWGGAHIGRTVAVAVAVPAASTANAADAIESTRVPGDTTLATAGATVTAAAADMAPSAAPSSFVTAAPQAPAPDTREEAAAPAPEPAVTAGAAAVWGLPVDSSARNWAAGAGGEGEGLSLDRFAMLSDAESDPDQDSDAAGQEAHGGGGAGVEGQGEDGRRQAQRGAPTRSGGRGRRGHGRGPAAAAAEGSDPWDSSSDEENPWGVEGADEMGYPLQAAVGGTVGQVARIARSGTKAPATNTTTTGAAEAAAAVPTREPPHSPVSPSLAATSAAAPAACGAERIGSQASKAAPHGGSSDSSSVGSWGVDRGLVTVVRSAKAVAAAAAHQTFGAAGALTAQALERIAAAAAVAAGPMGAQPPDLRAAAGGAALGASSLRHVFGLAAGRGRVVDPRDIPPLPLTPPPEWLVRTRDTGEQPPYGEQAFPPADAAVSGQTDTELQRPSGRVEAALLRAATRPLARGVLHDGRTFYFSEHPGFHA